MQEHKPWFQKQVLRRLRKRSLDHVIHRLLRIPPLFVPLLRIRLADFFLGESPQRLEGLETLLVHFCQLPLIGVTLPRLRYDAGLPSCKALDQVGLYL